MKSDWCLAPLPQVSLSAYTPPKPSRKVSSTASGPTPWPARSPCGNGVGTVVLDVRRGDGPPASHHYTFPALITKDTTIEREPDTVRAAVRAIVKVQNELKANPHRATEVGERLFPAAEAALIADLVTRDLPYYNPAISPSGRRQHERLCPGHRPPVHPRLLQPSRTWPRPHSLDSIGTARVILRRIQ